MGGKERGVEKKRGKGVYQFVSIILLSSSSSMPWLGAKDLP